MAMGLVPITDWNGRPYVLAPYFAGFFFAGRAAWGVGLAALGKAPYVRRTAPRIVPGIRSAALGGLVSSLVTAAGQMAWLPGQRFRPGRDNPAEWVFCGLAALSALGHGALRRLAKPLTLTETGKANETDSRAEGAGNRRAG